MSRKYVSLLFQMLSCSSESRRSREKSRTASSLLLMYCSRSPKATENRIIFITKNREAHPNWKLVIGNWVIGPLFLLPQVPFYNFDKFPWRIIAF